MNSKFSFNLNTPSTGGNTSNLFGSNTSLNTAAATTTNTTTGPQQTTLNLFGFGPKTTTPATATTTTTTLPGSTSFNTGFGQQQQQNKPIGLGFGQTATNASPFGSTTTTSK